AEMTHHYNTPNVDTQALVTQPQADLSFAFDNSENLQAVAMTDKQMQETQGAWVANAVGAGFGGLLGHFGYMGSVASGGQYNLGYHLGSIGTGMGTGFFSPVGVVGRSIAMTTATQQLGAGATGIAGAVGTGYLGNQFNTLNIR
ncbi:hypothetical protein, partial [Moraxella boevrei]|uniref:hypothetical protein n=1 Tax=Faucicola boevrei TaxID=346665 RepID=UPI003736EBE9